MDTSTELLPWHQALAYAVTGQRYPELGRQERPDVDVVAAFLEGRLPAVRPPGAHAVPVELSAGLGPAQLTAAVMALRTRLEHDRDGDQSRPLVPVVADRPLSADEQRLLREMPPHHGS
ncbi:hypothetical protein [uncultured Friedmanniella sp.]|uniref:hypothetical protein n=1 Tax=uncultured Friedmanniella sp. TaxID=335381 RepID=UPI0035C96BFE